MKKKLNLLTILLVMIFFIKCDITLADSSCDKFATHNGETCNYESSTPGKAVCKCLYDLNNNNGTACDNGYTSNVMPNICEASFQTTYFSESQNGNNSSNSFVATVNSGTYYSVNVTGCLYTSGISPKATCSKGELTKINVTSNKGEIVMGDFYVCYKNVSNETDDSVNLTGEGGPRLEYDNLCESEGFKTASKIAGTIILITKWLVPLILIIVGMIDFGKAILSDNDKSLSDATTVFIKRLVIAIIVPIVPGLLFSLIDFFVGDEVADTKIEFGSCTECLKDPLNCVIEYK